MVARGEDVARGEVDLEGGDPVRGARRRADLGGEVGQRGEVVAHHRGRVGEAAARELHPVAGVAGEPDDYAIKFLDCLLFHGRWKHESNQALSRAGAPPAGAASAR